MTVRDVRPYPREIYGGMQKDALGLALQPVRLPAADGCTDAAAELVDRRALRAGRRDYPGIAYLGISADVPLALMTHAPAYGIEVGSRPGPSPASWACYTVRPSLFPPC